MSLDVEYAIKKDIRNNPIVREVDADHKKQLLRTVGLAMLVVAAVVFWAWQRFGVAEGDMLQAQIQKNLQAETAKNRQLQVEVAMLRAPQVIETQATRDLHMVAPTNATTLVIDAPAGTPTSKSVR